MHTIPMQEAEREFARCWQAAGLHLQNSAQGPIDSWIRAHLNPPFLEHLSFRLGNQLFFIRIEDADGVLETPGSRDGLLTIADNCQGHACLMPMKRIGGEWKPQAAGWGLIDARTAAAVTPPSLITDELIPMTEWELQDFAVQIVRNDIEKNGFQLMSWQNNPEVDPSIWFVGHNGPEWVVVKTLRYPAKTANRPTNLQAIKASAARLSNKGSLAWVKVASSEDPFDPLAEQNGNFVPLFRGHGMYVSYEGLEPLDLN